MTKDEIKALRTALKLTQAEMAERLGVHMRTYQQWEYGRRKPSAATVRLLQSLQNRGDRFTWGDGDIVILNDGV